MPEIREYKITAVRATFNAPHRMRLTPAQASPRAHNLKLVKGTENVYELLAQVEFKQGEVVGYDGVVNKALALDMTPVVEEKKAPSAPKGNPGNDDDDDEGVDINTLSRKDLIAELQARKVEFKSNTSNDALRALLAEAVEKEAAGAPKGNPGNDDSGDEKEAAGNGG